MTKIFVGVLLGLVISFLAVGSAIRDGGINLRTDFNHYEVYKCQFIELIEG